MTGVLTYERKQLLRYRLLACAAAPQGVTRVEVAKFTSTANGERSWLRAQIGIMLSAGELHAVADPMDGRLKVLFATPEAGTAWLAALPPDRVSPWVAAIAKRTATNAAKKAAKKDAEKAAYKAVPLTVSDRRVRTLSATLAADAPVIVPDNVKRTVGPTHAFDARYQVDPNTRVCGGFATLGPGRYLEDGRP